MTAPITPWSADTGVSGEPLATAPAVQALQPLIDGASMASSQGPGTRFLPPWPRLRAICRTAEKNQQAKVGRDGATRMYADLAAVLDAVRKATRVDSGAGHRPVAAHGPVGLSAATLRSHGAGSLVRPVDRRPARCRRAHPGRHERPASAGQRRHLPAPLRLVSDHRRSPAGHRRRRGYRPA